MASSTSKRLAEFFAGIGLVRVGLERAGWECVFANDNDPLKASTYGLNFNNSSHLDKRNINELKPRDIPAIDLATASFPCTDLSLAGKRHGLQGSESSAFYSFINLVKEMKSRKPRMILLENVPVLLTSHGGEDIHSVLCALNGQGYRVDMFIVDARWFVPQSRRRLFVLGVRTKKKSTCRLHFERRDIRLKPAALSQVVESNPGVKWQFVDVPSPPESSGLGLKDIVEPDRKTEWWNGGKVSAMLKEMSLKHRRIIEEMKKSGKRYRTACRRVRNKVVRTEIRGDEISGCLRPPRGGSSRQILVRVARGEVSARGLTARECARLQGVDDGFNIPERQSDGLFGFGDAVCVPVIEWIGKNILNLLKPE